MNCREIRCNIQGPWMKNLMTEGKHTRYFWFCVSKCWFYCHLSRPGFSALTVKVGASSCRNLLRINSNWTSACVCKESKGSADSSELPTEEISQLWEETLAPPPQYLLTLYSRMIYERLHHPQLLSPINESPTQQKQCASIDSHIFHMHYSVVCGRARPVKRIKLTVVHFMAHCLCAE